MSSLLTSLKSRFDDSSTGATYRYAAGWVAYGNPASAYGQLMYLLQGFTDLCNQHDIEYWLDWGSLLGYLRHQGGLIPWDYDHDVGMRSSEYERFISIIERLQAEQATAAAAAAAASSSAHGVAASASAVAAVDCNNTFVLSDFTFAREGERGYYVMSLASRPEIQIDLVEYRTETDPTTGRQTLKHNMDDVTYEGFDYPDMPFEMVFPLRRVNMLGCATTIPHDSDAVTRLHFGDKYMEVLWVPYLLTKLYNPFLTRTLWLPPVREIPIVGSYAEGFLEYGATSPFLVRRPPQFKHITLESLVQFAQTCEKTAFGYDAAGEIVDGRQVKDLVREWQEDRLQMKVLDSPLDCCELPPGFVAFDEPLETPPAAASEGASSSSSAEEGDSNRNAKNAGLGLMLTRANAYTFLHLDPPVYGGGWMYLVSGRKSWHYIHPEFIDLLYDPVTQRLRDLPISELTTRFGYRLHGKVMHVTAEAGDLAYFPPCWMHRVRTFEKAIGISGYMKVRAAHGDIADYTRKLEAKGLNSIWNGNADI